LSIGIFIIHSGVLIFMITPWGGGGGGGGGAAKIS